MRIKAIACFFGVVAAFTACEMTAEVSASISAGGRASFGFVLAFDKEILDVARQTPQGAKAIEDLGKIPAEFNSGGWTFRKTQPNGGLRIESLRRFSTVEGLNRALDELRTNLNANSSATTALVQVFREFEVQRTPGFLKSQTRVSGRIDVTPATLFGGTSIGPKEQQAINEFFGSAQASRFFKFRVRTDLAGKITSSTGGPEVRGGSATWTPKFGQQLSFSASASSYNPFALLLIGLPLSGLAAFGIVRLIRRRAPRGAVPGWEVGASRPEEAPAETLD